MMSDNSDNIGFCFSSVIGRWATREGNNSYSHCQLGDWAAKEGDYRYSQLRKGRG
jgi:hypothetical protein